jgi:DNA-binding transcriptional LysR family regulator
MNRNDMRKMDLNLLIIFAALMGERNLTRASEKRFLGQRRLTLRIGLSCVPEQHASARRPRYSMLWRRPRASL